MVSLAPERAKPGSVMVSISSGKGFNRLVAANVIRSRLPGT